LAEVTTKPAAIVFTGCGTIDQNKNQLLKIAVLVGANPNVF
jgi:hypothetical protein